MRFTLLAVFAIMAAYAIWQSPRNWRDTPLKKLVFYGVHALGFSCLFGLLFLVCKLESGPLRSAIIYIETAYFAILSYSVIFMFFYQAAYYVTRHLHWPKLRDIVGNRSLYTCGIFFFVGLYLVCGIFNANGLNAVYYQLSVPSQQASENGMRVALVSDLHIGGGADSAQIDHVVSMLNNNDVDLVALAGDITDSSSSLADIEQLCSALKGVKSRYGIYYVDGNHEVDSDHAFVPHLQEAGVVCLDNEALTLPNNAVLLAVSNESEGKLDLEQLADDAGARPGAPRILMQHRPVHFAESAGHFDVSLSGHTHGWQAPWLALLNPFIVDVAYGVRDVGQGSTAVVCSGASKWGFHATWPSLNEVAFVDFTFKDEGR